ncbi:MAG: RHS repeat-associated core domain-containing protein [Paracoccus denitrificans]|uniref:RHS repeat-associated core domain-containing protein n=1 Tax=Paracoccus denitrificans TaxID=266 RepID=A0A533HXS8_PARDE|nr:MAG: RHS repeat-associated core domain-containing protein [Paracoccus denitrificans]
MRHVGSWRVERGDYWVENVTVSWAQPETVSLLCPIRFQGQWEDAESGLYYNRFRYYEPFAAQYASPDPIVISPT